MDPIRVDHLARSLSLPASRRGALGLAAGGALALRGAATPALAKNRKAKVAVCHNGKTLLVPRRKAQAHIEAGDTPGPCGGPPDWSLIKYVSVTVESRTDNGGPWPGLRVDFYYRIKGTLDSWSDLKFAWTADTFAPPPTYAPERYAVAAFVQAPDLQWPGYVEFRNGLFITPWAVLCRGGAVSGGVYTGEEYWRQGYSVGTTGEISLKGGGEYNSIPDSVLEVTRKDDTDTYKVFRMALRPASGGDRCKINVAC